MLFAFILSSLLAVNAAILEERETGGYHQKPSGSASFTKYSGCESPACGKTASGFTAAMNQLAYGAPPGLGAGDACGRCFSLTGNADPYTSDYHGPFKSIVVKVTDLCPIQGNEEWCGQTITNRVNQHGEAFHFDICEDTRGADAFFPEGRGALTGVFKEVSCRLHWSGSDGPAAWNGACSTGETAKNWPAVGCGNKGTFSFASLLPSRC